ncbi:putative sugar ABC transporter, substrate- binding protein [Cellulomonas flavigena DSM 20109]|uniref:Putative sugar ABC transporter, substrate-binding protein n=1 Tax=Cellulomonas flavigena (strain ATCC 482 / DSM 20109 / BCRC 11376 / JCM 18109 / NBRC 3775 / NCIMB 8073 / NRS 134) TaxID=446466 RepID=D5UI63_CELFN|nr:multiple monosaccharide ABC transporter substrate-binding protein [Cellulomonas flavigena]ADG75408.1 putative sugar ABC transporter, substrate- binding protein [Cellulomonas flavigena DSM 20109]
MSLAWKKSAIAMVAAGMLLGSLAACSSEREPTTEGTGDAGSSEDTVVGIAMPTKALERWNRDGAHLEGLLQDAGFETSLQFADNKVDQQITQLENMINQGADILVIASIDGTALAPTLEQAAEQGITVIAYDRLINDTPNVDYYATFDNYGVGKMQGEFIVEQLDLAGGAGPFNLEPFAGSPDDNNAKFFFAGAWDVLKEYVDSGQLVVPSGKAPASNDDWQSIGVQGWSSDTAQSEMENRLNSFYAGGTKVDVVLSPNDSLALGIAQALAGNGYAPGPDYPILTGQDADKANVLNMIEGKQSMSVWKDTRTLGDRTATMIEQIVAGDEVEVNDEETYDNGEKVVPTYLLPPQVITPDTVQTLVDSGFYTAADLGL